MLADDDLRQLLVTRFPELHPDVEGELDRLLDRAGSRARVRRATVVVGLVAAAMVAAALVVGSDWWVRTKAPEPVDKPPARAQPLTSRGWYARPAALDPGRYRASFLQLPPYTAIKIELDIPAGWGQDDVYAFATGSGDRVSTSRLDFYSGTRRVQPDPCSDRTVRAGPGALNLARALARLARTRATRPTPVTLDDYPGYYLRLTDPRSHVAAKSCRGGSVLREGEPVAGVAQACDLPGWTDLIWVIDVGADEPVIISATHGPDVTPAQEAELVGIVESASFVLP